MQYILKEFLNSFEEVHYFIGGISIGFLLGFILSVAIFIKIIIPAIKKKNGNTSC